MSQGYAQGVSPLMSKWKRVCFQDYLNDWKISLCTEGFMFLSIVGKRPCVSLIVLPQFLGTWASPTRGILTLSSRKGESVEQVC